MFEDLIPELQGPAADLLQAAGAAGLQPRITSTRRSRGSQEKLFRRWQSGLSPFPAAPPGLSAHEYGYAFDMVVAPMEALADVGYTWQSWGGVWPGAADPVHFEYPGFSPPTSQNIVQASASWFESLPWYVQVLLPISATTGRAMEARELEAANPTLYNWIRRTLGI